MRGSDNRSGELFSYIDLEQRVRPDHPLRAIRSLTEAALAWLSSEFAGLYPGMGRPSIAPEMLLRAMLLLAFYSIRSERQLMERLEFDLLFRWFVGLGIARLTRVSGHAERLAALDMIQGFADRPAAITLGADKGYDAADFVEELRTPNVRPHVARNTSGRRSAIDGRTTRHPGYAASQRIRKRIAEVFGWMKTVAGLRKTKFRGLARVDWTFTFAAAAYNLVRVPKPIGAAS